VNLAGSGRHLVRRAAEWALVRGGLATLARQQVRHRCLILCYHNVVPNGSRPGADASLHLSRNAFARQLDLLQQFCHVVSLSEALRPAERGAAADSRPRVVITFDDAYRGAMTEGLAEVRARGLPATVFVAPGALQEAFWWDEYLDEDASARRAIALGELAGQGSRVRTHAAAHGWNAATVPEHAHAVSASELEQALADPQLTLGAHSWSHPALPQLDDAPLTEELRRPLEWLGSRFPHAALSVIAYPYGLADARVALAAAAAGYDAGLRVAGGWLPAGTIDRFQLPRLNVPGGISEDGFLLRVSGMLAR
jgi:peptidoglycan/xylan/chitin deacetylase (PgdA/CDA1 family)